MKNKTNLKDQWKRSSEGIQSGSCFMGWKSANELSIFFNKKHVVSWYSKRLLIIELIHIAIIATWMENVEIEVICQEEMEKMINLFSNLLKMYPIEYQ